MTPRRLYGAVRPLGVFEMPPTVISILRQDTGKEPMRSVMADIEVAKSAVW